MKKKKRLKRILLTAAAVLAVCVAGFLIYASDYYRADGVAAAVMQTDTTMEKSGNLTILKPTVPTDTGLIFYPGAKVEETAYLPILEKIRQECGITCVLVKMPLHMAIFDPDAADEAMRQLPEIKHWYVGGHSMGGAMAGDYASKHAQKVQGLILMGAYIYGSYPPAKSLTIYGTLNADLEKHIDYTENIVKIKGGNHAQFGNYGRQRGDRKATISRESQQKQAVDAVAAFLAKKS